MFGWFKKKKAPELETELVWDFDRTCKTFLVFLVDNGSIELQLKVGTLANRTYMFSVNGDMWLKMYLSADEAKELGKDLITGGNNV